MAVKQIRSHDTKRVSEKYGKQIRNLYIICHVKFHMHMIAYVYFWKHTCKQAWYILMNMGPWAMDGIGLPATLPHLTFAFRAEGATLREPRQATHEKHQHESTLWH